MKKNNPLIAIFLFLLFLNSCGTIAEGLGGSKKKNSDEFMVEKKAPLVLPPSFGDLPEPEITPKNDSKLTKDNTLNIERIISQNSSNDSSVQISKSNSSIEKSIIEKINDQ
tara:strand:+ start:351 stop:683 length:333 start_codon:yes stop_codon:yes gene_type:complete